jgi:hypothetical protein
MSTEKAAIYQKIIDFQKKMSVIKKTETAKLKGITKTGRDYSMSYNYAPLDAIQKAIHMPLLDVGLYYSQEPTSEGLKTTIFDIDGNELVFNYPAVFAGKPQEIGSALTYAKRYSLVAALGLIIEGEDDDGNTAQQSTSQEFKKETQEEKETNIVWMTLTQFETLKTMIKNKDRLDAVKAMINKYSGQIIDNIQYKMKNEYKEEFKKLLENLK